MPRSRIPAYRLHKPSGLARVIVDGKHVYLGPYDSEESRALYAKLIAEHVGNPLANLPASSQGDAYPDISVNELLVRFMVHAGDYYSQDGKKTKEYTAMADAVVPLRTLFSHLPAREFGPLRLKAIQAYLVDQRRRCRRECNKLVERIRRVFGWAVSEELVPPSVHAALKEVKCLRRGKTTAHEAPPVLPVDDNVVNETLPFLTPPVAAMVRVQRAANARPGEIVIMRVRDLDMTRDIWLYRPNAHKNSWREKPRIIALGPAAQAAIRPFLNRPADAYLFSPQEAEAWRHEQRVVHRSPKRKCPIYPSELRARERRKKAARKHNPKRPKRDRYDVDSYRRAVQYGIQKANRELAKQRPDFTPLETWHPYQLRHTAATMLRKRFGAEAVSVGLGNSPDLIELYAERDLERLCELARELG